MFSFMHEPIRDSLLNSIGLKQVYEYLPKILVKIKISNTSTENSKINNKMIDVAKRGSVLSTCLCFL